MAATSPGSASTAEGSGVDVGERVFHQKFGYGAITGIEGDKLEIDFEKAGPKKVVAKFVVAAAAAGDVPF